MHIAASLMTVMARPSCMTVRLFGASHCHVLPLRPALPNRRLHPQPGQSNGHWSRSPYIGSPLNASFAEFFRFMLQFLCLQMCVYGGGAVPQGGWGGASLDDRPPWAGRGPSSLGWGRTRRRGEGTCLTA